MSLAAIRLLRAFEAFDGRNGCGWAAGSYGCRLGQRLAHMAPKRRKFLRAVSLGCSGESLGLGRRKGPGYRRRRGTGSRSRRGEPCTIASFTSPDSSVRHAASRTGRATVATEDSRGQGIRPRLLLSECSRNHWHKGDAGHSLQSAKTWARHPCKARRDTPLG
jgi:hypothetical protein